jgi:dTDP-4-dehydrorhamnose reductase
MLGSSVAKEWRRRGAAVLALSRGQADIRNPDQLFAVVDSYRPQLVINCAAFTKVDACEEKREEALEINGRGVANVAAAAERVGAELIHISSDYVFDGEASTPYTEDAATGPRSVYGLSKLRGEEEALRYGRALVLRASWLFGPAGPNFVVTISRLLRQGQPLKVVDDQVGCPTYTPFLARAIWDLAPLAQRGILHYRNREPVSWHAFATEIARSLNIADEILPIPTSEFPRPACRPAYSVLNVERFEAVTGRSVEPWIAGLTAYLDDPGGLQ